MKVLVGLLCLVTVTLAAGEARGFRVSAFVSSDRPHSDTFFFDIQPRVIAPGQVATIRWRIKGATGITLDELPASAEAPRYVGAFGAEGSLTVKPLQDTTYIMSCRGATTFSCSTVSIRVRPRVRQ